MSYNNYGGPQQGYNQGPPQGFGGPNQGPPQNGPPGGYNQGPGGYNQGPGGYNQGGPGGYNQGPGGYNQGGPGGPGGFNQGGPGGPGGFNGPPNGGYNQGGPGGPGGFNRPPPNGGFNQGGPGGPGGPGGYNNDFRGQQGHGPNNFNRPPQQGGGFPPPNQQPQNINYFGLLKRAVNENELGAFYNDHQLQQIAQALPPRIHQIAQAWNIPMMIAQDLARLALYDMVLYVDDSGSMRACENGDRIEDMKLIVSRAAFLGGILDSDGIQVRFMNSDIKGENLRNEQQVFSMIQQVRFEGITPLGTELKKKVIEPLVKHPAKHNQLRKPVLIITITDGEPVGESPKTIFKVVEEVKKDFLKSKYRPGACSFQFAQVGNDMKAREFLGRLDSDPVVGKMIDCTSSFEIEEMEMAKAGARLEPSTWIVKMFLGSVDPSYDSKDEKKGR